jgi:hypothetical protein
VRSGVERAPRECRSAKARNPRLQHRQVRYVHLNPCRDRFANDPLVPVWSTHRGAIGGEVDPWVSAERLSRALGLLVVSRDKHTAWALGCCNERFRAAPATPSNL